MVNKPENEYSLFYAHEDRLRSLEAGMRSLEVLSATTAANLQALSSRVDSGNENIMDRLDAMKENLLEKVTDIGHSVDAIHGKERKLGEKWAGIWPKVIAYFLTSGTAGAFSLIVHDLIVRTHMSK